MTSSSPPPLPTPRARRPRRIVATALLATATVLAGVAGTAPVSAEEAASTDPTMMAGRGTTDSDQIQLSGSEVESGSASSRAGDATAKAGPAPGEAGWSQVIDLLDGTQMVAFSWDGTTSGPNGPESGQVSVRTRTGDEQWSEWTALEGDPDDDGGEGTGRVGTGVTWLGEEGVDEVEVRVDAGPLVALDLLRMRYHEGEAVPVEDAVASRAGTDKDAAKPTVRPRSAWATKGWASYNSGCGSAPKVASRLDHAVVHHTASSSSYSQSQVPGLLDGIRQYHQSSLGWCDTAYNFVVDKYGGIWQGRDGDVAKPVIGGHAQGFNTYSTGVALLGNFETGGSPTSAMVDSTARLLAWKLGLHGLNPNGTVTVTSAGSSRYPSGARVTLPVINPHQATGYTACPGVNVMAKMGTVRSLAASYMSGGGDTGGGGEPSDWDPFDSVESLVYRQYVDFLRSTGSYESRLWWNQNLSNGSTHRNALLISLLNSEGLQDRSASSVRLYLAYFGRIPDHSGLRYWWAAMDAGKGIRHVSAAFARSPEFTQRYGNLTDAQFVDLVYRNVLDRAPDAAGYDYWTGRLRAKRESRGGLMTLFSESGEYRSKRRDVVDVVITHEAMLQRGISTASMLQWVARVEDDRTVFISHLFASREYANRVG